jgi:2-polyprenyl-3-methyl-5-hydroxy-6-metoxy-1,4-benzoquinol methylase
LPKIVEKRIIEDNLFTLTEWLEGETGEELLKRVGRIPEDFYFKLGDFAGKLHNEKILNQKVSVMNYWPRNVLIKPDGKLVYIDLNKLYYTEYQQGFIDKSVIAETPTIDRSQANAFLSGYRQHKEYDIKQILKWHLDHVSEHWHSVYMDGHIFYEGKTDFYSRLEKLNIPEDLTGKYVLDLGYAEGMFALECAKRGATRVYAIDNRYINIRNANYRISDYGKLLCVYHGYTEDNLLFKHMDINNRWFIDVHMTDTLNYIPKHKWDIVFAMDILRYIDEDKRKDFEKMLYKIAERVIL